MFFENGALPNEDHEQMRAILAHIQPKTIEDVRMVASALKTAGERYYETFLEWAKPFGRFKAKQHWGRVNPDPDALIEVGERQLAGVSHRGRFKPRTAAELEAMPMQRYRIKGVFPAEGLAAVYGPSGSAKSFLCTAAAAAIAEGSPFFDHATTRASVLYVALEGEGGYRGRVIAWQRHHGRTIPAEVRFLLDPFRLTEPQDVSDLAAICPPGVVIFIDTLNRAAPGTDENSSKDMGAIIEGAKTLQRLTAGLVVLVAHTGKDTTKGLRGHSSLIAALDAAIFVDRNGVARTWRVEKAKDGEDGQEHGFHLKSISIGTDADGEDATSAVVIADDMPPPQTAKPLSASRKLALDTFHEAAHAAGIIDNDGAFVGLPLPAWRSAFYRKSPAENEDAKRKAFNRARTELVEQGMIAADNDVYRLAGERAAAGHAFIASAILSKRDMSRTLA